jgi:membrane-bound lytic murein transglycosylase D
MRYNISLFLFFLVFIFPAKGQDSLLYKARFKNISGNLGLKYSEKATEHIFRWTRENPKSTGVALGLADYYFPYIDSVLKSYKLPTDLKFVAFASSLMDFRFFDSLDGSRGLWHFNFPTAKLYDLKITSYIDERLNFEKSTHAFARALSEYYRIYNDWPLSIAAFYSSATKVNKAIRYNNNSFDYWKIRAHLSEGAQEIIPRTIAAIYVYNYAAEEKIQKQFFQAPAKAARISLNDWLSLEELSKKSGVPLSVLQWLNPEYKKNIVPDLPENQPLYVPSGLKDSSDWILSLRFFPYQAKYYGGTGSEENLTEEKKVMHTVKAGEDLASISALYSCQPEQIKEWNGMEDDELSEGQELEINVQVQKEKSPPAKAPAPKKEATPFIYIVKSGDTLSAIAKRNRCTVAELKSWNGLKSDHIRAGQKLKINKKGG